MRTVRRVGVLGAGTMGARIAAHFANAGVPVVLLDMVLPGEADRNAAARRGLEAAKKQRPVAFYSDEGPKLVTIGNYGDDLEALTGCDWVIEAVAEDLDIKREVWRKAEPFLQPSATLSTNTSGISLARICESFPADARRRFLGTHFFNPPRYLHLVEIIPGPDTDDDVLLGAGTFCDRRLGKGVVPCKDTPNFIANRIGGFFGATVHRLMETGGFTIEEVDALTGSLIGLPKSASFRLLDIIGLDVWKAVIDNLHEAETGQWRERFELPGFLKDMIGRGWLGEKTSQGFYRRVQIEGGRVIEAIDWKSLEYHPAAKPELPSVEVARAIEKLGPRLRYLVESEDRTGRFVWDLLSDLFLYAAELVPEVSDRIVEIDRAMRWGYAFELGPFGLWDALGFETTARRLEQDGRELPENVQRMLERGAGSFYRAADQDGEPLTEYFDLAAGEYAELEQRRGTIELPALKRARGVVEGNNSASLVDLGDGVLCAEFHTKMNALGKEVFELLHRGLQIVEQDFKAMVVGNQGAHFSAGANLMTVLLAAQEGEFDRIEAFIRAFQDVNMALRCAAKPVVAAPFGHSLGGGCELALHAARVQAGAELYMGLVEVGVGLIPAAGGVKQMLLRFGDAKKAYDLISRGKASGSAVQAREMELLQPADGITMNPERLLADAKRVALAIAPGYVPRNPREDIEVGGEADYARIKMSAWLAHGAGRITDHDLAIAEKLAYVLSGGRLTGRQTVSEQYLLDLEREAFLSLCGTKKTQERIAHMLRTGKRLKN